MKKLLVSVFLTAVIRAVPAFAQPEPVTSIAETMSSTSSIQGVSISSYAATSVILSTGARARSVAIENIDSSANLFCAERTTISTSAGVRVGWKIFPGQTVWFALAPASQFYCVNDGGSSDTWAVVYRGR